MDCLSPEERLPDDETTFISYADSAIRNGDWREGATRWSQASKRFPDLCRAYFEAGRAFRLAGQLEEADAILAEGRKRFPTDDRLVAEQVFVAERRLDWTAVARHSEALREIKPDLALGYLLGGVALKNLGCLSDADGVFTDAAAKFPGDARIQGQFALSVDFRGDFVAAAKLWITLRERFPDNPLIFTKAADALLRLKMARADAAEGEVDTIEALDAPVTVQMTEAETIEALSIMQVADLNELRDCFLGFESLGMNCEFGLVQRHFGAEPLGLLRWNSIAPADPTP